MNEGNTSSLTNFTETSPLGPKLTERPTSLGQYFKKTEVAYTIRGQKIIHNAFGKQQGTQFASDGFK